MKTLSTAVAAIALLTASTAVAQQSGYQPIHVKGPTWTAKSYGVETLGGSAMQMRMFLKPTVDVWPIERAWLEPVLIGVAQGPVGAPMALLVGFDTARIPLTGVADGTLLVSPAPIVATGMFASHGSWAIKVDLSNPALVGLNLAMQGVAIGPSSDAGPTVLLSDGLQISVNLPDSAIVRS